MFLIKTISDFANNFMITLSSYLYIPTIYDLNVDINWDDVNESEKKEDDNEYIDLSELIRELEKGKGYYRELEEIRIKNTELNHDIEQFKILYKSSANEYNNLSTEHSNLKFKYYKLYHGLDKDTIVDWKEVAFSDLFKDNNLQE